MLSLLISASLLFAPCQGEEPKPPPSQAPPTTEQVARTATALDEAFRSGDAKLIQSALEAAQAVPHANVVRKVVRGLDDERAEVVLATLQALRWLDHPEALETLHREAKGRKHTKTPELTAALLRAIGQHADPSSIALLSRDPFEPPDYPCVRARILALGRIRSVESLEALLGIVALTTPGGERRIGGQMNDVRLSLMVLTGVDQGTAPENWERWWRANKAGFAVAPELPLLPKELLETWDNFWGLPLDYQRDRRREDRGQEPGKPPKK